MGGSHGGKLLHSTFCTQTSLLLAAAVLVLSAMYRYKGLSAFFWDLLCPCQTHWNRPPDDKQLYECLLLCRVHHARTPAPGKHMGHLQDF